MSGGGKLMSRLRTIANKVKNASVGTPEVRVGWLADAKYPNGTQVALVAAIQEFGAPSVGIPPRPFFRPMIAKHRDEWGPGLGGIMVANDFDARKSLAAIGQVIEGQLRQAIVDVNAPALSPTTLMLRKMLKANPALRDTMSYATVIEARARVAAGRSYAGVSTKPLIDTAHMLNTIDSEVG